MDKGAESDGLANEFADVVLDLVERIPYIKVLISTLLPRFDSEDQMNMSNPNNVRKVMNVEISMRLQDKPNIEFINNDTVLEWWKDDVKKMRLFRPDGYHLSAYGFSMMLEQWMKTLKSSVSQLGLTASDNDGKTTNFPFPVNRIFHDHVMINFSFLSLLLLHLLHVSKILQPKTFLVKKSKWNSNFLS